jgi:hypothetical protein
MGAPFTFQVAFEDTFTWTITALVDSSGFAISCYRKDS